MARELLQIMKLTPQAVIPKQGSALAAGLDLSSAYDCVIPAGGKGLVKTDLSIAIPDGCYARVAPRSGLAHKKFIDTGAGVIDADYRGNVGVILFNHSKEDFEIKHGDRVAQLILERIAYPEIVEVDSLPETARGSGGFGSTGMTNTLSNKRQRDEDLSMTPESLAPTNANIIFEAFDLLKQTNDLSSEQIEKLRKALFQSGEAQYALLHELLNRYISKKDSQELQDWVNAL